MRSKGEGGTVFTVCDACWDKRDQSFKPGAEIDLLRDALAATQAENASLRAAVKHRSDEIARLSAVYEAAKAWKESDCYRDCPLFAEGPHAHHCRERAAIVKLVDAIDAALAEEGK
jgi:hypothetical protein